MRERPFYFPHEIIRSRSNPEREFIHAVSGKQQKDAPVVFAMGWGATPRTHTPAIREFIERWEEMFG